MTANSTQDFLIRPATPRASLDQVQNNTDEPHALRPVSRAVRDDPAWFRKYMLYEFLDGGRSFKGVDCWGLIYSVYKCELGIILPSYDDLSPQQQKEVSDQVEKDTVVRPWIDVPLSEMRPFDMVILRGLAQSKGKFQWMSNHVGIVTIPPYIMHIEDAGGVMHLPIMNTNQRRCDDLLSRRVRRIVRHERTLDGSM